MVYSKVPSGTWRISSSTVTPSAPPNTIVSDALSVSLDSGYSPVCRAHERRARYRYSDRVSICGFNGRQSKGGAIVGAFGFGLFRSVVLLLPNRSIRSTDTAGRGGLGRGVGAATDGVPSGRDHASVSFHRGYFT